MIVCELLFDREDPEQKGYSLLEEDYYAWIPAGSALPNHRLSVRKNLTTGEYEVYRRWMQRWVRVTVNTLHEVQDDRGEEEIAFKSQSLQEALDFACNEWNRFHLGHFQRRREGDQVCTHQYPKKAIGCPIGSPAFANVR